MQNMGSIFLYNNNLINKQIYHQQLEERGYYIFDTDNLHQFDLYNKEISPNVILLDFDKNTPPYLIRSIEHLYVNALAPIIVVSEHPKALIYQPNISHYINHTVAKKEILDILSSYSIGNQNHQILYINLKPYERANFTNSVKDKNHTLFEVHNVISATKYLEKNTPQIICINFLPALSTLQKNYHYHNIFYVENEQNIEELEHFLH